MIDLFPSLESQIAPKAKFKIDVSKDCESPTVKQGLSIISDPCERFLFCGFRCQWNSEKVDEMARMRMFLHKLFKRISMSESDVLDNYFQHCAQCICSHINHNSSKESEVHKPENSFVKFGI